MNSSNPEQRLGERDEEGIKHHTAWIVFVKFKVIAFNAVHREGSDDICQYGSRTKKDPARVKNTFYTTPLVNSSTLVNPARLEEFKVDYKLSGRLNLSSMAPESNSEPSKIPLLEARRSYKHIGVIGSKHYTLINYLDT